jgi:nucleobase:cation symporter-1, NCS1 family
MSLVFTLSSYINIFYATLFISLFCIISMLWNIIKNAAGLLVFLSSYSCLIGPLARVIVSDYYLIKKRKLNIHEVYQDHSIYHYSYSWN